MPGGAETSVLSSCAWPGDLLQRNSNSLQCNSNITAVEFQQFQMLCDLPLYCSSQRLVAPRSASQRRRRFIGPNSTKRDLVCAELIFSAAGADACNSLILREPLGLVAQFQRTFSWDVKYNPVTYLVSIAYLRNERRNLGRSCEPLTNLPQYEP
jgi:hypothetical protein